MESVSQYDVYVFLTVDLNTLPTAIHRFKQQLGYVSKIHFDCELLAYDIFDFDFDSIKTMIEMSGLKLNDYFYIRVFN